MKKVFVADKHSYGSEFFEECDSLDDLKKAIVEHETRFNGPVIYTEDVFKEVSSEYTLVEIDLHEDEFISWNEYDGQSWFEIRKKDPKLLSITKVLSKGE